jgi:hypothetical protein
MYYIWLIWTKTIFSWSSVQTLNTKFHGYSLEASMMDTQNDTPSLLYVCLHFVYFVKGIHKYKCKDMGEAGKTICVPRVCRSWSVLSLEYQDVTMSCTSLFHWTSFFVGCKNPFLSLYTLRTSYAKCTNTEDRAKVRSNWRSSCEDKNCMNWTYLSTCDLMLLSWLNALAEKPHCCSAFFVPGNRKIFSLLLSPPNLRLLQLNVC